MRQILRLGTRSSLLAQAQARLAQSALKSLLDDSSVELFPMRTTGDARQGTSDACIPDKQMWVRELEEALLRSDIDIAIHSAKDVPIEISPGTCLLPILGRNFPEDVFFYLNSTIMKKVAHEQNSI